MGAWIVHHGNKLQNVTGITQDYDQLAFAAKCGVMLNALARSDNTDIETNVVHSLAKANGISPRIELPTILTEFERQRLIDLGESGISILGLTTAETLENTTTIFNESNPSLCEKISLEVSETVSDLPVVKDELAEYVSDVYKLPKKETNDLLIQYEEIGFFDHEEVLSHELYFNGNLFRREDMGKVNGVLSSLSPVDQRKTMEISTLMSARGCIPKTEAFEILGKELYAKLCSIGFIDENSIGNESGTFSFVTRPAAFCKFTNSAADDAFDLAKAFVTSLTYGMTLSRSGRGRITMIKALMRKLIDGQWVGSATAIGHDYKVLEMKGVVQVRPADSGRFDMRLLKKDVGKLALEVITEGEASTHSLLRLPSASATMYHRPEDNRVIIRKKQSQPLKKGIASLLDDLRTGGLR